MPEFRQLTGRGAGRKLPLADIRAGGKLTLGRDDQCDFVVDEEHISGLHLEIEKLEDGFLARDRKSTNGTVVVRKGRQLKLEKSINYQLRLKDGDVLYLGDPAQPVHLRFSAGHVEETRTKQELLAIAHLTGVPAFENRIRENPEQISTLYQVIKELAAHTDPAQVGTVACEGVFKLLPNGTHVVILLEDSPGGDFIHFVGLDHKGNSIESQNVSKSTIEEVRKNKAGVWLAGTDIEGNPAKSIIRLGIRTIIAAPLWIGDRVTGVMQIDNRDTGTMFTQSDLEVLVVLAGQVSLAVQNTRLTARLRAAEQQLSEENTFLKEAEEKRHEIIGESSAMKRVYGLIDKVCGTKVPVCIEGETGTGKELVAHAIHYRSDRRKKLFVAQNCAAISENILESELFGHVKGAFTSADRDKKGLFEIADGGTIFLDEIGETTPGMQAKLLRVLQEGEIRPVGATRSKNVDVRVISATNRNLEEEVEQGRFREDLYYRLKVFPIRLPPLRDRREDIPLLARHFLSTYCREAKRPEPTFSPEALATLMAYRWPGNVRELQNEMQRLVIAGTQGDFVMPDDLSERLRKPGDLLDQVKPKRGGLKEMLEEVEKWIILDALREQANNKTATAGVLQISREGLHKKLARYGLS